MVGVGQQAVFRCRHPSTTFISWRVNETITVLEGVSGPSGITAGRTLDVSGNVIDFTLTIVAQSNYNETQVKCIATFRGNQNLNDQETTVVNLTIQGKDEIRVCTGYIMKLRSVRDLRNVHTEDQRPKAV